MAAAGGEQSIGPTARRMILGSQLRALRERAELTRSQVGYQIRSSESKISRIELGKVGFKDRDITDMLTMYGVNDSDERQAYLGLLEESKEPGWWRRYSDLVPDWFDIYVGLEEAAMRIQTYELQFVPGLLQIEGYTRAVVRNGQPALSADDVERVVAMRMRRQKLLARPDAPRLWAVIDESVLYRPIGGAAVLRAQLDYLLEVAKFPNISLQVLPYDVSGFAAEGSFSLLRFAEPELPNIVYLEHRFGGHTREKLEDTEPFIRALDRLMVDAQTPERSRQTLLKRRDEI